MSPSLPGIIEAFDGRNVLVIGEAMLDVYLEGTTKRLCPEAPVPVVDLDVRRDLPGGAANTAINVRNLGARVKLVSVIGDDCEGDTLRGLLKDQGIDECSVFVERGRRTLAKHRLLAGNQMIVRFDQGDTAPLRPELEESLIDALAEHWADLDAVIVSDYGYGVLTEAVIARLAELQGASPRVMVVDSKRLALFRDVRPTAVKPNHGEALRLLGATGPASAARVAWMAAQGSRLLELSGAQIAVVTIDSDGSLVFEQDRPPYRSYARPDRYAQVSGAGDTFVATLSLALASGAEAPAAADLASAAAAVVVAKEATSSCSAGELRLRVSPAGKPIDRGAELAACLDGHRRQGHRVVFTNGCFDILHRGHVSYLSRAKALGDVLIVGVNSDASIRRLKGPERPINDLDDRLQVLAALSCVDHVIPFDEDTPHALIGAIRPDVFVKGGDYTRETLPEADLVESLGGRVEILSFVEDRSTSRIVARIRQASAGEESAVQSPADWSCHGQLVQEGSGA